MLRNGDSQWNNRYGNGINLPEESTLQAITEAALAQRRGSKKRGTGSIKIINISGKPHHTQKNSVILSIVVQVCAIGTENVEDETPISVLMKKIEGSASVELQAYSTLFKDLQPDSQRTSCIQQHGNLYNLIPRPYLIQKSYLFLENSEHLGAGKFRAVEGVYGRNKVSVLNLDFNHCLLAVETLARFHASSYSLRKQFGVKGKGKLEMLHKYPFLNQQSTLQQYSTRMSSQLTPVFEQAFDLAVRVIQQENPSLAFKLQRKVTNPNGIFDKLVKLLEEEKYDNDDFYVVCHGNLLAETLLFSYDQSNKNEEPTACRITNLNSIFFGPLASDLALFLLTCTSLDFRLEFEEKLLAFYCDAFQEELVARLGRNSLIVEEFEENIDEFHRKVEKQYKKMLEFAFYNVCVLLPIISFAHSASSTDNNNDAGGYVACSSIKDLFEGSKLAKYFCGETSKNRKDESEFERFVLENSLLRERFMEILKQLSKYRVML